MKITMEFTCPEEQEDFDNASNGSRYLQVINDLDAWLRSCTKYDSKIFGEGNPSHQDIATCVREKIWELRREER